MYFNKRHNRVKEISEIYNSLKRQKLWNKKVHKNYNFLYSLSNYKKKQDKTKEHNQRIKITEKKKYNDKKKATKKSEQKMESLKRILEFLGDGN